MSRARTNARQGPERVVLAFLEGRKAREGSRPDYKAGARYETDGRTLVQWGSVIARKVNGSIEITDAGWRTVTTRAMLNAVLQRLGAHGSIFVKSHQWFLETPAGVKPWSGKAVIKLDGGTVSGNPRGFRYPAKRQYLAKRVFAKPGGREYDISERRPISGRVPRQVTGEWKIRSTENPVGDQFVLGSSPMIYAPGVVKWIMHGYATSRGKQKRMFASLLGKTWHLPAKLAFDVTTGKVPFRIEGEGVVVTVPGKGRSKRLNPLTRVEAGQLLRIAKRKIEWGRAHGKKYPRSTAKAFGVAHGLSRAVQLVGPHAAYRAADRVSYRADLAADLHLPNPISCLKNLHTKAEQDRAIRLIHRYYLSGINALKAWQKEKAAHAYGALAAIRRLAKMERPIAQRVANFASFRMDCLRSAAKGQGRYRTKVVR